jgi:two-component system response regulator AtoC
MEGRTHDRVKPFPERGAARYAPIEAMLGESKAMQQVRELIARAAPGNATVLVRGESGTGKELAARAIHEQSPRRAKPFVKVHCAALPDNLLESELFGYERGAFTGADARKPGRVELARGGTLFLDEIGDITPATQVKLLRLLQDRQYERLGGTETLDADVRFVAATHRDLEGMSERGEFRQDLFYRLNVVPIWMPPLRARRDDIEQLARSFCEASAQANAKPGIALDAGALAALRAQRWPGNVRQLQNLVERLVVLAPGETIGEADVKGALSAAVRFVTQTATPGSGEGAPGGEPTPATGGDGGRLDDAVRDAERKALLKALEQAGGNRTEAARILGVSRRTLYTKLEELGIG